MKKIITFTANPSLDLTTEVQELKAEGKTRTGKQTYSPGGGGINIARVLHKLQVPVECVFPCGGTNGEKLIELLRKEEVPIDPLIIDDRETRLSFSFKEIKTGEVYHLVGAGNKLEQSHENLLLDDLEKRIDDKTLLIASGSLPKGFKTDFYARLGKIAKNKKAKLILDTSKEPLVKALKTCNCYLWKGNRKEYDYVKDEFAPHDFSDESYDCFEQFLLHEDITQILIHTLGSKGAHLSTKGHNIVVKPEKIHVKSTVGAGDSFLAGVIYGLYKGMSLVEIMKWGMATALATLSSPGHILADITSAKEMLNKIHVEADITGP